MNRTTEHLTDERCAHLLAQWRKRRLSQLARRYPTLSHSAREDLYADAVEHILKRMKQGHGFNDEAHLKAMLERALAWQALDWLRRRSREVAAHAIPEHELITSCDPPDAIDNKLPEGLAADFLLQLSELEQKVFRLRACGTSRTATARALNLTEAEVQLAYRHAKARMDRIVVAYDAGRWCAQRSEDIGAREIGQADRVTSLRARAHLAHCVICRRHAAEHRRTMRDAAAALLPFPAALGAGGGLLNRISAAFAARLPALAPGASTNGTGEKFAPLVAGSGAGAMKIGAGVAVSALTIGAGALGIRRATHASPKPADHHVAQARPHAKPAAFIAPLAPGRNLYRAPGVAQRNLYQATHLPTRARSRQRRSHATRPVLEFGGGTRHRGLRLTEFGAVAGSPSASPANTSSSSSAVTRSLAPRPTRSAYPSSSVGVGQRSAQSSSSSSEFGPP